METQTLEQIKDNALQMIYKFEANAKKTNSIKKMNIYLALADKRRKELAILLKENNAY